jgi:hypothetical protein
VTSARDYGLAGDRIRLIEDGETIRIEFGDTGTGRVCGSCSLCCKLLPTPELSKPANQRCCHQRASKGCAIYADRPTGCRSWACRWLADTRVSLPRPDRAHYVIDMTNDYITLTNPETGEGRRVGVLQIWVDPAYPDAHRDLRLRSWLDANQSPALIRFNSHDAIFICPPSCSEDRIWHEMASGTTEPEHPPRIIAVEVR